MSTAAEVLERMIPLQRSESSPEAGRTLSVFGHGELQRILHEWSGPEFDPTLARDELLHELFEQQVDARPAGVAVECGSIRLTYAELDRRSNQLAHFLRSQGIGRGHSIGMALPRTAEAYVALLGIMKAGAAYVPLDPETPADRVAGILQDAGAPLLITMSELRARYGSCGPLLLLDSEWPAISAQPARRLSRAETGLSPNDVSYVIYTSGSTGKPKGVQVEHRNVCHLVRSEGRLFPLHPSDRVYQGFSVAFDASVEEIWLAFFAGATLVVGTKEMQQAGPALARLLTDAGVTVLSCVPTLLSILEGDIPTLRLLIVGGEACPQKLVQRWARPGRRFVNTYGPTEATVIATYAECKPDQPVTIGRPIPNDVVYILDEELQPVPTGVAGELYIGGMGVARGYLGRADLTDERFIPNPFHRSDAPRLYRTGDLTRFTSTGDIEFLGRIDGQVKIRGFRVELAEIESVLLQCAGVQGAAVTLRTETGLQQLVGYVIPAAHASLDEDALRAQLRLRLPSYMVPALIETVREFPTLSSGKVDRKRLPAPRPRNTPPAKSYEPPHTATEKAIAAAWEELFKPLRVSLHDDFFLDLGGHSLLAATMVSTLRQEPAFQSLSVLDVYNNPTVHRLAAKLDRSRRAPIAKQTEAAPAASRGHRGLTIGLQTAALYLVFALFAFPWIAPYFTFTHLLKTNHGQLNALLVSMAVMVGLNPAMLLVSIATKWLVIGRFKPGVYPLWSFYYVRWWFVNRVLSIAPSDILNGTPLLNLYYRALGARIGRDVHVGTDNVRTFDLVSIGDETNIGVDASLLGYTVENGALRIGRIDIGKRCFVGTRAVVAPDSRMEDDAQLFDLSLLPSGATQPRGETRVGSPARRAEGPLHGAPGQIPPAVSSRAKRILFGALHALGSCLQPLAILLAALPGIWLMRLAASAFPGECYLLTAPIAGTLFVLLLTLEIAALKWLLLGRVKPGRYPTRGWFYLRKWFIDQLLTMSIEVLGPLYATLYLAPWYRLLGAKLGRNAEISTASYTSPDMLTLGDETFIADGVSLGAARVERGFMTLAPTQVGRRAFVGNSAVIPAGTSIGESALIGVLSLPPLTSADATAPHSSWLGTPAVFLPQRQQQASFADETTFQPTRRLVLLRALIEFFRVTLPATMFFWMTSALLDATEALQARHSTTTAALLFPLLYVACAVGAVVFVIAAKWTLIGRFRPGEKPLWCSFVWLNELVTALHESIANPMLINHLLGTPYVAWFFRALGAKIGKRVYFDTNQFTEYDLARIGSDVALNADCTIQTHLFEDRVMKMSTVEIADGAKVGAYAVVLYDTRMEPRSSLGPLSLLMKGETLPAATQWLGAPAQPSFPAEEPGSPPGLSLAA